jgi:exopolysaccharide biosynthesis protein
MKKLFATLATTALAASMATAAHADSVAVNSWNPIFQGIDETSATIDGSQAFAVRIDLNAPGISFTTTPQSGPLDTTAQTTSQFMQSTGTQVAINADFFDPCCNATGEAKNLEGLAISNGNLVSPNQAGMPVLLLTQSNQATIAASPNSLAGVYNAVSGSNIVVANGQNVAPTADNSFDDANPRSVVGVSQNGQFMYLVAIDGREADSVGTSLDETAELMLALGAYDALNLDGGGSTALVADENGTPTDLNVPSGGTERFDGNNLGVFANALPVPEPATVGIFGLGLLGLTLAIRRRRAL